MANTAEVGTGTGVAALVTRTFTAVAAPVATTAPTTGQLWPR